MDHREAAASSEATVDKRSETSGTIKLGVDIHRESYAVVSQHGQEHPKPPRKFSPSEFVPWVERLIAAGHEVAVVYESCGFGFDLQRQLQSLGAACYVISPQKLDENNSRVKTDGRDARTLCLRLSRYLAGNRHELAVIRVPGEEEERRRHWPRQRGQLVHVRQKMEAQGRSLLVNHSLPAPAHWWKPQTWKRLQTHLPPWIVPHLETYRPALLALDGQILQLTAQLCEQAPAEIPRGLGKLTCVTLEREVCDWSRFRNRRQVSSYTGLCPGEYSSGGKRLQGSVTKHGNPRLRAALVELAWRLVRFQPQYPPVRKRLAILAPGARATGAVRKKAIVAVARQLAVDLWRLNTHQTTPEKLGLEI
jgi:transposase